MIQLPWSDKTVKTVLQYRGQDLINGPLDEHFGALLQTSTDFAMMTDEYLVGEVMARPGLPMRERSMIIIAVLLTQKFAMGVIGHMRWALNLGISRQEVLELIVHVGGYTGWPSEAEAKDLFKKAYPIEASTESVDQETQKPAISEREQALVILAVLITWKLTDRLRNQILRSMDLGITQAEILEAIMQVTPFVGWPTGVESLLVAESVFNTKK